jgi:phosphoglycerol transferase MdoB-like AlkP superfamily enzyme
MAACLEQSDELQRLAVPSNQASREGVARLLRPLLAYPTLSAVGLTLLCVGLAEMLLMERKYGFFSSGFLQAHPLITNWDRVLFVLASMWVDFTFFFPLALAWNWLMARLGVGRLLAAYHFWFIACGACLAVAAVHYRLLAYFSDTINFTVARRMAGGNVPTMLSYAARETGLAVLGLVASALVYAVGLWMVRRLRPYAPSNASPVCAKRFWPWKAALVVLAVVFVVAALQRIEASSRLHYSLRTKISYNSLVRLFNVAANDTAWLNESQATATAPPVPRPWGPVSYRRVGPAKNLVLVVLESARGELIGKQIDGQLVAPNLTRLAATGTSFTQAYAHCAFTVPAKSCLFTGSVTHGDPDDSLFGTLHRQGYEISVFSSMDEAFGSLDDAVGMERASTFFFDARQAKADRVFPFTAPGSLTLDDQHLFRVIAGRLPAMDWRKPQFLYINFQAAHYPYHYPSMPQLLAGDPIPQGQIGPRQQEWVARTYWNALSFVDGLCGRLLAELQRLNVLDNTVVAFVGDHGESLYEDGTLGHGHALNEIQTCIPFLLSVTGVRAEEPIGQAEAMPLLLRAIGLESELSDQEEPRSGPKAVFQYIGDLQQPVQIGLVDQNERRTILDLRTRQAFFSDRQESVPYQELGRLPELSVRVRRLIAEWKRHCAEERRWTYRHP